MLAFSLGTPQIRRQTNGALAMELSMNCAPRCGLAMTVGSGQLHSPAVRRIECSARLDRPTGRAQGCEA